MHEQYIIAGRELGLSERLESETQLLAVRFTSVNLEGLAPFDDTIAEFNADTSRMIQENWEVSTREHPGMFPGPLVSVRNFSVTDGTLNFALKRSRFDIFHGLKSGMPSRINPEEVPLDRDYCLYLCIAAVTVTKPEPEYPEGAIIFGIRNSRHSIGPGLSNCLPSGLVDADKDRLSVGDSATAGNYLSVRLTALRELIEETGIIDYREFEYLGLVYENAMAPGICVAVRLKTDFTVDDVRRNLDKADRETEKFHFAANNLKAVRDFLRKYPPTPHSAALLALHFTSE